MRSLMIASLLLLVACGAAKEPIPMDAGGQDTVSGQDTAAEPDTTLEDISPDTAPQDTVQPDTPQDTALPDTTPDTTPDVPDPCGDGECGEGEDPCSCPDDCLVTGETCCEDMDCPQPSCGPCCKVICAEFQCTQPHWEEPCCWNNVCEEGEDAESCPEDCWCGNETCDPGEDALSCPGDCEVGPVASDCADNPDACGAVLGVVTVEVFPGGDEFPLETPYPGCLVQALVDGEVVAGDLTDDSGEYGLTLPPGQYLLRATHPDPEQPWDYIWPDEIEKDITIPENGEDVTADFLFHYEGDTVDKPNIYLYPEKPQLVSVQLDFTPGNFLVVSDPDYQAGWQVLAQPEGSLEEKFGYLFYEAAVTTELPMEFGHNVPAPQLVDWMKATLPLYGLNQTETRDFVEFWAGALPSAGWYTFYPLVNEQIDPAIRLKIYPKPDSLLRLWFIIVSGDAPADTIEPNPRPFERVGFTAVEWGVIVK